MTDADWDVPRIERLAPDPKAVAAARKLLTEERFSAIETLPDGRGWWARCRGVTGDYEVSTSRPTAGNFSTQCTCPSYKQPCKHAVALLLYLAENPQARPADEPAAAPPRPAGDFEALLAGVFAAPDDDVARLVFADFVEEQGDTDRATLIRLQVERSRREAGADAATPARRRRAVKLPAAEAAIVENVLAGVPDGLRGRFFARRGFLVYLPDCYIPSDPLADPRVGPGQSRAWPRAVRDLFAGGWVETIWYSDDLPVLTAAAVDVCRRVGTVDLGSRKLSARLLAEVAVELLPGEAGSRLKHVALPNGNRAQWAAAFADPAVTLPPPDEAGARAFTDPPDALFARQLAAGALRGVRRLAVTGGLSVESAAALAAAPDAAGLTELNLADMPLTADHADALGASPRLAGVKKLKLSHVGFAPGAAAAWLASRLAGRLGTLDLTKAAPFTDTDVAGFRARPWPGLTGLALPGDGPTFAAVRTLLMGGTFPKLAAFGTDDRLGTPLERLALRLDLRPAPRYLQFGRPSWDLEPLDAVGHYALKLTHGTPADWPAGAESLDWSGVRAVALERCEVAPEWFATLAACVPGGLDSLALTSCDLKGAHAKALAAALGVLRPAALDLARNNLGVQAVQALVKAPGFDAVRRLNLSDNPLQPAALDVLLASPHFATLEELRLSAGPRDVLPAAARKAWADRVPASVRVVWA